MSVVRRQFAAETIPLIGNHKIMAQFDVIEVLNRMRDTGMVPVFYHADPDKALQV